MATVCLAVMAKDEAHVIARALASAKSLVDAWVVLDTGSSDATAGAARDAMAGVPGEVVSRPWRGFDKSRTELFEVARTRAEYVLMLDADDVLEHPPGARFPELYEAGYTLVLVDGPFVSQRVQVFASAAPWRFEGVLYEQPLCDALVGAIRRIDGILYRSIGGGARSKDPDWCLGDVELLAAEVRRDPSNARNVFYLGRTYEGAGDPVRALAQYERRALMGGAPEELYCAVFNAARVREELCFPRARVEAGYLEAWMLRPWRAEPLHRLAVVAREAGDLSRARALAGAAQAIPFPRDEVLTVNREVYLWRALDELAAACTKLGNLDAAIDACKQMLARPLPPEEKARIHANVAACQAGKGG